MRERERERERAIWKMFFKTTILKIYFLKWQHFLSEQFWKCIFEVAILYMYFQDGNFENVFLEGAILKMHF